MPPTQSIPDFSQRQIMICFMGLAYCGEAITTAVPAPRILQIVDEAMPQIPSIASPNPTAPGPQHRQIAMILHPGIPESDRV